MIKKIEEGLSCDYRFKPVDSTRTCKNCKKYRPVDAMKGICYEYEVLPYGGCKYFEPKKKNS